MTLDLDPAALDLARFIRPGDTVAVAQGSSEPLTLTEALIAQSGELGAITVFLGLMYSDTFAPDAAPGFRYSSYGALGSLARFARAGRLEVVPCHYSQLPWLLASGPVKADVVHARALARGRRRGDPRSGARLRARGDDACARRARGNQRADAVALRRRAAGGLPDRRGGADVAAVAPLSRLDASARWSARSASTWPG